jgi:putative transposase
VLTLGLWVSPRTVRKYLLKRLDRGQHQCVPSPRWQTFVHTHAKAIVACDFCTVITATFRIFYVFVVIDLATRSILHVNVTAHPTAEWTMHQAYQRVVTRPILRGLHHGRCFKSGHHRFKQAG